MRLAGRLTEWNDGKGFGFVEPNGGGDRAFVHVSAFQRGSRRPAAGDLVSYTVAKDARGRLNARDIRHAGQRIEVARPPSCFPRAAVGGISLGVAAVLAVLDVVPAVLVVAVFVLSVVAYAMYALDKSAARRGGQRIPESSLHLVGLAGGWPGALVAQQQLRHKTVKQPFQSVFWVTVALNLVAMAWIVQSGVAGGLGPWPGG